MDTMLRAAKTEIDEISEALGDTRYIERWAPPELTRRILGVHSTKLVRCSRYYFLRDPRVVVDFEPSPLVSKMFCEAKREFCHTQGIVYVPIFLRERLRSAEFAERLARETAAMQVGEQEAHEDEALRSVEDILRDPAVETYINAEALSRLAAEMRAGRQLKGATRAARLTKIKEAVTEELRRKGSNELGREFSHRQLAVAAG